jgi:hypothetical protein
MGAAMAKANDGFLRWLGRQVGYVKKAVQTDPAAPKPQLPQAPEKKLYENKTVEESPHPENPNVKLRRTIIDEAIQQKDATADERG